MFIKRKIKESYQLKQKAESRYLNWTIKVPLHETLMAWGSYTSAERQLVYSTARANIVQLTWAVE